MCTGIETGLAIAGLVASVAGTAASFVGQQQQARQQAAATRASLEYQAEVQANNQRIAQQQAQDAIRRGEFERQRLYQQREQVTGTQRAALAASGLDIQSGSPLDTITDTAAVTELDALTVTDNARREAWGYQVQGSNAAAQAGLLRQQAGAVSTSPFTGVGTLLTGASTAFDTFSQWRRENLRSGSTSGKSKSVVYA